MKWEEIVKIQYDAMQRSSLVYITILSAIAAFQENFNLSEFVKVALAASFMLVLLQSITILYLTNIQRQISWKKDVKGKEDLAQNEQENSVRWWVLFLSAAATLSVIITILLMVFFPRNAADDLGKCLNSSESVFAQKHQGISSHVEDLKQQKASAQELADREYGIFLQNNPEPKKKPCLGGQTYLEVKKCAEQDPVYSEWIKNSLSNKDRIYKSVNDIGWQIENISSDFEKIEKEKKEADDICYKKFK